MKIVDVCEFYSNQGGGVRNYVREKLAAGHQAGLDVVIIAPGREDWIEERDGGRIFWVRAPVIPLDRRYHLFAHARPVHEILAAEQPDVVEGSSPWRGGWIAASWRDAPVRALFMHSDPVASYPYRLLGNIMAPAQIDSLFGWFWRYLRRLSDCFDTTVVGGEWLAARLTAHGLQRLSVIPLGVEKRLFTPNRRNADTLTQMQGLCGLGPDGRVLVAVGRLHPEKRIETLMRAVDAVRGHKVGLLVIGDGPIRKRLERRASELRHVRLLGAIEDRELLATMVATADALLHGCASETFGLAVSEAISAGTPIIVPDRGGASVVAGEGYAAVYRAGDALDCQTAIERILSGDQTAQRASALAARESVTDASDHFAKLFDHYAALVAARRSSNSR